MSYPTGPLEPTPDETGQQYSPAGEGQGYVLDLPRPEPVLDAQQLTRAVLGVLGAVSTLLAIFGITLDTGRWDDVVGTLVGLGVLTSGIVLPRIRAKKARALVTPIADPRAPSGRRLVEERRAA